MKLKLTLVVFLLGLATMAQAQGPLSNLSIGIGLEGIFPAATFNKTPYNEGTYPTTQSATKSVGGVADARYNFGRHSALDFSFTLNRNTEYFANTYGTVTHVQTNNGEYIGSYVARMPGTERMKPYFLVGGGMVHFSPNSAYNTSGSPSGSSKAAFAYGFGTDIRLSDSWGLRIQYRGLVRGAPDFKLSNTDATETFGSEMKTHVPEPSIQVVYHF
ncbi:MAG: outer membrane beta-barrel protein [Acidobacteriota bacterium]|nr:outer membrane beta-barrel protein [Acidobacteriota bacterium]